MGILHLRLSQQQARKVTRLLASETAQRVMDCIAEESKPETVIAKELGLPLSTVHYNVQKLLEAGLVASDEYTYSEKGKEVRHYKLSNEHVVITTAPFATIPAALTGLGLSVLVAAGVWFAYAKTMTDKALVAAPEAGVRMFEDAEPLLMQAAAEQVPSQPALWPWVLLGAGTMLLGILIVTLIQRYRA